MPRRRLCAVGGDRAGCRPSRPTPRASSPANIRCPSAATTCRCTRRGPRPGHAPIILAISEIWGVHEYIRDCTRRFAKAGFYAVAPELFQREGGVGHLPNVQDILKIVFAVPRRRCWATPPPPSTGPRSARTSAPNSVGVTGWCWGGSTTIQIAATNPDIKAAVVWYGPPARPYPDTPHPGDRLRSGQGHQGAVPRALRRDRPEPEAGGRQALWRAGEAAQPERRDRRLPGAGHGFHADYRPSYNAAAAADGWKRCIAWFDKYLKA